MEQREGNTASSNSRKRAQRVQLACDPCRLGKLKCDRNLPICDQCYKRSRESACKYTERGLRYNTARHKADSMREKIDRLETFVNRIKESRSDAVHHEGGGENVDDPHTERELIPLTGKLNLSGSGTRYVGGAHWESIIDDIADVKAYFELESSSPGSEEPVEDGSYIDSVPSDSLLGVGQSYSKRELLQQLPPKAEMDKLVALWFNVNDPIRLIVHSATFQKQYQAFWGNPDGVSPAWLSLLYSVGAAGAQLSGQARRDINTLALAEELRRLTVHALVLAESVFPKPFVIEALMFYEKSLLLKNHDTLPQAWQVHGQVMRLCFHSGYHRDPGNNPNISAFDCEMRRRVWLMAVEYDILCSYQVGLASLINFKVCDTKPPSNLIDSDFSTDNIPVSRSPDDYTLIQAAVCHGSLVAVFGDVIMTSHTIIAPSEADIKALHERLDRARDAFPETLKIRPTDQCFMDTPGQILDRYRLELLYDKALSVLYRRFLNQPGCEGEHEKCIAAAEATVMTLLPLLEAAQPGGSMHSCLAFIYRHIHDFNLAAMLLCSEFKRLSTMESNAGQDGSSAVSPTDSSSAFATRVRAALLHDCALWLSSGVVSPKARQAVRAIEKFLTQSSSPPPPQQPLEPHQTQNQQQLGNNKAIPPNTWLPGTSTPFGLSASAPMPVSSDIPQVIAPYGSSTSTSSTSTGMGTTGSSTGVVAGSDSIGTNSTPMMDGMSPFMDPNSLSAYDLDAMVAAAQQAGGGFGEMEMSGIEQDPLFMDIFGGAMMMSGNGLEGENTGDGTGMGTSWA